MNTKKIWIIAIIFGALMSVIFFILTNNNGDTNENIDPPPSEEVKQPDQIEPKHEEILDITVGKRAMTIPVNEVQSVSGFVQPGSFVDVVVVQPIPIQENTNAQILIENVKVLAVGKTVLEKEVTEETQETQETQENTQEPYQMVTLEVSPTDGANLALAKERGTVTLMLRGSEDEKTS
ncbi:Flp pilus assembly protein CpaB [Niallia sp. Krafla_26]|uniref:Flp pilus assembly protein CpaB n=1 Tax=Niallia sp. Krafla_26 TaxID=3064703 RepID=UPI003D17A41D